MEGFTYTDIFETKGIEYIIIIAFLAILIPFWMIINKKTNVVTQIHAAIGVLKATLLKIPQGIFFNKNHTWAFLEKGGNAKVGLDDFLLKVLGDVKITHVRNPGEKIMKGELMAELDQNGKRLKIMSPISGIVVDTNSDIRVNSQVLNNDPYENGWIYAIKPFQWKSETEKYFLAEEASTWFTNEVNRFKDFLAESIVKHSPEPSMVTYQEGGEIRQHVLSELDGKVWGDFQESFLD